MIAILTQRIELREFRPDDEAAVHAYGSDPEVTRYLSWGPNSEENTRRFLKRAVRAANERPRRDYEFAIVERATEQLIGGCGLRSARAEYHEYALGYCLRRDRWGAGVATEVVRALTNCGMRALRAHRIFALVDAENLASCRLLERLGYRMEGEQRADTRVRGAWRDTRVYAVLADEWEALAEREDDPT